MIYDAADASGCPVASHRLAYECLFGIFCLYATLSALSLLFGCLVTVTVNYDAFIS